MENINEDTIEIRQIAEKKQMIEKLKETPIIQVACQKAGISRATYYRWKKEDVLFRKSCDEACNEGVCLINDVSESQLISLIKDKKLPAISLWLKNNHPRYGAKVVIEHEQNLNILSSKQEEIVKRALYLVKPKKSHE